MVTIYDIAKACGVSSATVSKALNGHKDISEKTKKRVIEMADQKGYTANAQARMLKTRKSYNIGVLLTDDKGFAHPYFVKVLESLRKNLECRDYDVTFLGSTGSQKTSYLERAKRRMLDGIVAVSVDFNSQELKELTKSKIPIILLDKLIEEQSSVLSDNYGGMYELVQYIIDKGHTKIAYVHGQDLSSEVTRLRLEGFRKALEANGIPENTDWIKQGVYSEYEVTAKAMREILELEDRPTALLVPDDSVAFKAYSVAKDLGLKIPDDISIAGYDGIELSQIIEPKLTTVYQDTREIGRLLAENLIDLIENKVSRQVIYVPSSVLKGESIKDIRD